MRVLSTGANGHLGANVVRALRKRGYQVVPFVRQGSDLRGLDGLGLEYVYGDVMDEASLVAAAEGCDVMLHMAAVYRFWKRDHAALAGEVGGRYLYYDSTNTTREFGIPFSGAEQAIAACIRWLLHMGQIKPALAAARADRFPPDPAWRA